MFPLFGFIHVELVAFHRITLSTTHAPALVNCSRKKNCMWTNTTMHQGRVGTKNTINYIQLLHIVRLPVSKHNIKYNRRYRKWYTCTRQARRPTSPSNGYPTRSRGYCSPTTRTHTQQSIIYVGHKNISFKVTSSTRRIIRSLIFPRC